MSENSNLDLNNEDFQNALKDIDTFVDVSTDDLMRIQTLAYKHARLRQTKDLCVKDIMTNQVITVRPETSIKEAAQNLLKHGISGLPVVDNNEKLVGIVTEADFLIAIGIPYHHPTHNLWRTLEAMFTRNPQTLTLPKSVSDIMESNVIVVKTDSILHDVIDTMKQHHIKRLVVVDESEKVQGIITRSNLVRVLLKKIL